MHRQALHRVAAHRHLQAVATQHLAVDLQNNLDFGRDFDYNTLGLRWEESRRVVLGDLWKNMAGGQRRCIELGHGLEVGALLQPSQYHGRGRDQRGDVGVL